MYKKLIVVQKSIFLQILLLMAYIYIQHVRCIVLSYVINFLVFLTHFYDSLKIFNYSKLINNSYLDHLTTSQYFI